MNNCVIVNIKAFAMEFPLGKRTRRRTTKCIRMIMHKSYANVVIDYLIRKEIQ